MCVHKCGAHVDGYIKLTEVDSKIIIVGLQIHVSIIILVMYMYILIAMYYTCTCATTAVTSMPVHTCT